TNAYDEAITTPTEESVRRAMAIQLIINKEWGLAKNENPHQGSFVIDELTDLVEEAVLKEFEALSSRGGVLGAMETGYQRGKIQEESLHYERQKHDGTYPIIGVNTFRGPAADNPMPQKLELIRSTEEEKQSQLKRLRDFQKKSEKDSGPMLERLRQAVIKDENVFAVLIDGVRVCSLGQITHALFEVGGQYRRSMWGSLRCLSRASLRRRRPQSRNRSNRSPRRCCRRRPIAKPARAARMSAWNSWRKT